jgi:hypothetical protein
VGSAWGGGEAVVVVTEEEVVVWCRWWWGLRTLDVEEAPGEGSRS